MPGSVHAALIAVQVMFASLAIAGRFVLGALPAGALIAVRVVGAAGAFAALNAVRRGRWITDLRDLRQVFLLGTLGITANQSLFVFGLRHTTAVNATILVTLVPAFTVLGSVLMGVEAASPRKFAGVAVAFVGALWLIGPDRLSLDPETTIGNALIVLGMLCYAAYFLRSKALLRKYDAVTVSTYVMLSALVGAIPFAVGALRGGALAQVPAAVWAWTAYIVVFPTVGTYLLNLWALRRASSDVVAVYIYLQPLVTAVVAPLVLPGEALTPRAAVGGALIFAGVGLVLWAERVARRRGEAVADAPDSAEAPG